MGSFVFFWKKATGKLILLWFRRNDKQVKNKNAVRIVPMYNKLIEIGFIEYVDSVNRKGEERVFFKLSKTERVPRYGKQVGKWIN